MHLHLYSGLHIHTVRCCLYLVYLIFRSSCPGCQSHSFIYFYFHLSSSRLFIRLFVRLSDLAVAGLQITCFYYQLIRQGHGSGRQNRQSYKSFTLANIHNTQYRQMDPPAFPDDQSFHRALIGLGRPPHDPPNPTNELIRATRALMGQDKHAQIGSKQQQQEAKKLLEAIRTIKPSECTMQAIKMDYYQLNNTSEPRMVIVPYEAYSSSEEEMEPNYQTDDELIQYLSGAPEKVEMFFVAFVIASDSTGMGKGFQCKAQIVKSFKQAQPPIVSLFKVLGPYHIYRLYGNSLLRSVNLQISDAHLNVSSNAIQISSKKTLICKSGLGISFLDRTIQSLTLLEELVVLSLCIQNCEQELLSIANIKKDQIRSLTFDTARLEKYINQEQKRGQYFSLMAQLLDGLQIKGHEFLFRLFGRTFINVKKEDIPNPATVNKIQKIALGMLKLKEHSPLGKEEAIEFTTNLISFLSLTQTADDLLWMINFFTDNNLPILSKSFGCDTFIKKIGWEVAHTPDDKFKLLIATSYYYIKQNLLTLMIDAFDYPQDLANISDSSYDVSSYKKMREMLDQFMNVMEDLPPTSMLKFLNLYSIMMGVWKWNQLLTDAVNKKLFQYIDKVESKCKDKEHVKAALSIIKQAYLGNRLLVIVQDHLRDLSKRLVRLLYLRLLVNDGSLMKLFNSEIFIKYILKREESDDRLLRNEYLKILKNKNRSEALSILNAGLSDDLMDSANDEGKLAEVIKVVIDHFYTKKLFIGSAYEKQPLWHERFEFCCPLNEKILEKMIKLNNSENENTYKKSFVEEAKKAINKYAQASHRERLKIIVEMDQMKVDEQSVVEYLQNSERLYLLIIIKLRNEQNEKSMQLINSISAISTRIQGGGYPRQVIERMLPTHDKDKDRFIRIFGEQVLKRIESDLTQTAPKISRLNSLREHLSYVLNRYNTNEGEFTKFIRDVEESIEMMNSRPINNSKNIEAFEAEFPDEVLILYQHEFFYKNQDLYRKNLNQLREINGEQLNFFYSKLGSILGQLDQGNLKLDYFFDLNLFRSSDESLNILLSQYKDLKKDTANREKSKQQIRKAINLYKEIQVYNKLCEAFTFFMSHNQAQFRKYQPVFVELSKFAELISKPEPGMQINLAEFEKQEDSFHSFLKELKIVPDPLLFRLTEFLPLEELEMRDEQVLREPHVCLALTILVLHNRFELLRQLSEFEPKFEGMMEICREEMDEQNTLQTQDFKKCSSLISFYRGELAPLLSDRGSVENLVRFLLNNQQKPVFLNQLVDITNKFSGFERLYLTLSNRKEAEQANISSIINDSIFAIRLDANRHQASFQMEAKFKSNKMESLTEEMLDKFKDEALVILTRIEDEDANAMTEGSSARHKMETFLKLHHEIQKIKETYFSLLSYGYLFFKDIKHSIAIKREDLTRLIEFSKEIAQVAQEWKKNILGLYENSVKATMLKGRKLKEFYLLLTKNQGKAKYFRYICPEKMLMDIQKRSAHKYRGVNSDKPEECLEMVIKEFFKELKNERKEEAAPDRDEQYVKIVVMSQQDGDYITALNKMKEEKLKRISDGQILHCIPGTQIEDVESFMERALRNIDEEHMLIGYDNLSLEMQAFIIDMIQKSKATSNLSMKLTLVGNSAQQRIYRYMRNELNYIDTNTKGLTQNKTYQKFMESRIIGTDGFGKVQVYSSSRPGLGKTQLISEQLRRQNLKPIVLPLSGRVTISHIFERLSHSVYERQNAQDRYGLVVQLYEIDEAERSIVNEFLTQICLWRSYGHRSQLCCMDLATPIFIQLQDQSIGSQLPFVQLLKKYPITIEIEFLQIIRIRKSLEDKKLIYIIEHLKFYHEKKLASVDLPSPQDFKVPALNADQALQLIDMYFFRPLSAKNVQPTFYLYQYWVTLFYESCSNFSCTWQIRSDTISSNYNKKDIEKYKMNSFREKFFGTLIENAISFLSYSVDELSERDNEQRVMEERDRAQQFRELPFLMIPNAGHQWFSFIYRSYKQIPEQIQNFLIANEAFNKKRGGALDDKLREAIFAEHELETLEKTDKKMFYEKITAILKDISGNTSYVMDEKSNYTVNMDNFTKMCVISYRMKVNIPLVIQGEAGVGKTALLRHLVRDVFKYEFISKTLNAGLKQEDLRKVLRDAQEKQASIDPNSRGKVCLFLDEFNTLPEVGYIKELVMEGKFMGKSEQFLSKIIIFAACNPYRQNQEGSIAFKVKRIPRSMGQVLWNFGSLGQIETTKYIESMLSQVEKDLPQMKMVQLIGSIQGHLMKDPDSLMSLRDVERFRQLYSWLKSNLPRRPNIQIRPQNEQHYANLSFRSMIVAMFMTYLVRFETTAKRSVILRIINENSKFKAEELLKFKEYEEQDFCSRLKIQYDGIAVNSSLQENLFCCFVAIMNRLPVLIIGKPGCSKSLSARIIRDNFKRGSKIDDEWMSKFPRVADYPFQGSQNCESASVEKIFTKATNSLKSNVENSIIPLIVFDEMGLAEIAPDNPLKVIHEPLELTSNQPGVTSRQLAFLGMSNDQLDISKMSRFLVLQRPDLEKEDLTNTSHAISKSIIKETDNFNLVKEHLKVMSESYKDFIEYWKSQEFIKNDPHIQSFFGLRDFYNLVKTFSDEVKKHSNAFLSTQNLDQYLRMAIFRNFSGFANSFDAFKEICSEKLKRQLPENNKNTIQEIISSLQSGGRRYPLVILKDKHSEVALNEQIYRTFSKRYSSIKGSPFKKDQNNSEYIVKCLGKIVKQVEQDRILCANSLNRTVETALFDLFNKFFIKRGNEQAYRVAMDSGLLFTQIVHPKFNFCLSIQQSEISKVSAAFLNRFEKYEFNTTNVEKSSKLAMEKLNEILRTLEDSCQKLNIKHYKPQHLFMNISREARESFAEKVIASLAGEPTDENLTSKIIEMLGLIATKDFEYIFRYILEPNNTLGDLTELFAQALANKEKAFKNFPNLIVLSSDVGSWRSDKPSDYKIELELCKTKTEKEMEKEIAKFLKNKAHKSSTLYIDFKKTNGDNMNNNNELKDEEFPLVIDAPYITNLFNSVVGSLSKDNFDISGKRVMLVFHYNRNKDFTSISYMNDFPIIAYDGSSINSSSENKDKVFQNIAMDKLIKDALSCFDFKFDNDHPEYSDIKDHFNNSFIVEVSRADGLLANHCKDALMMLEGKNIEISEQEIVETIQNPQYLRNYDNIQTVLTQNHFSTKLKGAIVTFIQELIKSGVFYNYGKSSLNKIFDKMLEAERKHGQVQNEIYSKFMREMAKMKINKLKNTYNQKKRNNMLPGSKEGEKIEVEMELPRLCAYSGVELDYAFGEKTKKRLEELGNIESVQDLDTEWRKFSAEYKEHLVKLFPTPQVYHNYYRQLNAEWKSRFEIDLVVRFLKEEEIPVQSAYRCLYHLNLACGKDKESLEKIGLLLSHRRVWAEIFSICSLHNIDYQPEFSSQQRLSFKQRCSKYLINFIRQVNKTFNFNQNGVKKMKGADIKKFFRIYTSIYFHVANLINLEYLRELDPAVANIIINSEFITFWMGLKIDSSEVLDQLLDSLDKVGQQDHHLKFRTIKSFLISFIEKYPPFKIPTYEYLANKLFPKWFQKTEQGKEDQVYHDFVVLSNESSNFTHSSMGSLKVIFHSLRFDFERQKSIRSLMDKTMSVHKYNSPGLYHLSQSCLNSDFKSNISVLLCNDFYGKMWRNSWICSEGRKFVTFADLQTHYEEFDHCITDLQTQKNNAFNSLIWFAYLKLYLYHFVQIMDPAKRICTKISDRLSEKGALKENLRVYCMKILRKKMTTKEIYDEFIKKNQFSWTTQLAPELVEAPSRAIHVPKLPNNAPDLNALEEAVKKSDGKDLDALDKLIRNGSSSPTGRYQVLTFFLKYVYPLAYNSKEYQKPLQEMMTAKMVEYSKLMGEKQYELLMKYSQSKLDGFLSVDSFANFNEDHILILNNINWILSDKTAASPLHSLFFSKDGKFLPNIQQQISASYLPCGIENPYISIAKSIITETHNNNIGVYICGSNCDYIYCHLDCGWPSESRNCPMCGQKIGSAGGHKLNRTQQGARRVISEKVIDKSMFYISSITKLQNYWEAQRFYITAEINRIRKKPTTTTKTTQGKETLVEEFNFLGYNLSLNTERVSNITAKVITFCFESILYTLVTMNVINEADCQQLFGNPDQEQVKTAKWNNIMKLLKDIKEVVNIEGTFSSWMYGVQQKLFECLNNFPKQFSSYETQLQNKSHQLIDKLKADVPNLTRAEYKVLYEDFIRVIQNGLIFKEFQEVGKNNDMSARNQFTRQVFEEKVQSIVSECLYEQKTDFVKENIQIQGKMQFEFESVLVETELREDKYQYLRVLKAPSVELNAEEIMRNYEIIIQERYPVLDYLLKNRDLLKLLSSFYEVMSATNRFKQQADFRLTRDGSLQVSVEKFSQKPKQQWDSFFKSWKRIAKDLGPVQVQCKVFGTMNDEVTADSPIGYFLTDNISKQNANGKIMVGLLHNYASYHNQFLNIVKNRKNQIEKYRGLNLFLQINRVSPQFIKDEQAILLEDNSIIKKLVGNSVSSIVYGEQTFYHNFDLSESELLMSLRGRSELQTDIETYLTTKFVNETFCRDTPGENSDAVGTVKDRLVQIDQKYLSLQEDAKKAFLADLNSLPVEKKVELKGELQYLILQMKTMQALDPSNEFMHFCTINEFPLEITHAKSVEGLSQMQIGYIVPLYEIVEANLADFLLRGIPDKYKQKIPANLIPVVKGFITNLPVDGSPELPSPKELKTGITRFMLRNLMAGTFEPEAKFLDFVLVKEDFWLLPENMYGYLNSISQEPIYEQLLAQYSFQFLQMLL